MRRNGRLTRPGDFYQSLYNKTRVAASYPATGSVKFPRATGPVSVFWVNGDGTVSRRVWNYGWGGVTNLDSSVRVNQDSGLLAWSWVPPNALGPVSERILYVGTDGRLHGYYFN
jgi:hypothetical protein